MKRKPFRVLCLFCAVLMMTGVCAPVMAEDSAYRTYLETGEYPSLWETWREDFKIGVAVSSYQLAGATFAGLVKKNFNSITCENEMKADAILDQTASVREGDPLHAKLHFNGADKVMDFAQKNGIRVRAHTLIWHSQTPRWFFTEGYSTRSDAPLVDRETMLARMENYIRDEMEHFNTKYPGVIYAWDVVNEAIDPAFCDQNGLRKESIWYQVVGPDYIEQAFTFARKYAAPEQKLFYNDYSTTDKVKRNYIVKLLRRLTELGIVDGMGMQSHIGVTSPSIMDIMDSVRMYTETGVTVHITELDISSEDPTAYGQMLLAARYRSIMNLMKRMKEKNGFDVESVTLWGLLDSQTWLTDSNRVCYPLLFDSKMKPKPAFFGAILDESIPKSSYEEDIRKAVEELGLDRTEKETEKEKSDMDTLLKNAVKPLGEHNPLMVQSFGADPWALIYDGRVYIYMTGDSPVIAMDGTVQTNTYANINTIRVISSADLVNWTDHGAIPAAGKNGAAKWATNSWAPAAAWKTIDGQDKFFLYFADSGNGIGVLTADSPVGPFTDPLGRALVNRATPTCSSVTWLFDPAVLVDDDGSAWLYVGGGVPAGRTADPGTARVMELNSDMISLKGTPQTINPPYLFEDSGINKFGDLYYYSYCTNFNVTPAATREFGFESGEIAYMISDSPAGPFTYAGGVLKNPGHFFGVGGNNHHCMFEFNGKLYITYHAQTLEEKLGMKGKGYRSTFINELTLDPVLNRLHAEGTLRGVAAAAALDPYQPVAGVTVATLNGVSIADTEGTENGTGRAAVFTVDGILAVENAAFGENNGKQTLRIRFRAEKDVRFEALADPNGDQITLCDAVLAGAEGWRTVELPLTAPINGSRALVFRFTGERAELDMWQFIR